MTKPKTIPPGPTNATVAANVARLRKAQRISAAEFCRMLTHRDGRPMAVLSLTRLEAGERRIDVDDLFALADALGVSPVYLLAPDTGDDHEAEVTCTSAGGPMALSIYRLWSWLLVRHPLRGGHRFRWQLGSMPLWLLNGSEDLAFPESMDR